MAKLPQFQELGLDAPQAPQGVASYRGTTGAETAPGEAIAQAGATMANDGDKLWALAKQEKEKYDTVQVEDAWNKYKNHALDLTNGERGLLNTRGADAINGALYEKASVSLKDARKTILDGLQSDEQRLRFSERANATDLQTKHQVLGHLATEQKQYAAVVMGGSEAAANAQVTAMPTDPAVFDGARDTLMRQADAFLKGNGVSDPGAVAAYKDKLSDGLWKTRIDALVLSQPILADAVFRASKQEIKSPELRLQLHARVAEAAIAVSATADAIKAIDEVRASLPPVGAPDSRETPATNIKVGAATTTEQLPSGARSVRNNNPGNITKSNIKWAGEVQGTDSEFVTFATPEDGMRAMQQNLLSYQNKLGLNTVSGIINRWSPANGKGNSRESTDAYIARVSQALGVKPTDKIDLNDPKTMRAMTTIMAVVEAGGSGSAQVSAGTTQRVSQTDPADPLAQNTSGMPNARDIGAQLPLALLKVEQAATTRYGADALDPDRVAFVKRMTAEVHALIASDVQQWNALQRQAQGVVIDAIFGLSGGGQAGGGMTQTGTGAGAARRDAAAGASPGLRMTSFAQIQSDPKLMQAFQQMDPLAKEAAVKMLEYNARTMAAGGTEPKGDPLLFKELFKLINLPPDNPNRIKWPQEITTPAVIDRLSPTEFNQLRHEIERYTTPGGRTGRELRTYHSSRVERIFKSAPEFMLEPGLAADAYNRWNMAVSKKIDEYAASPERKDINTLFMPDTPDSMIKNDFLKQYMTSTTADGLAKAKAAGAAAEGPPPQPASIKTKAELHTWMKTNWWIKEYTDVGQVWPNPYYKKPTLPEEPKADATPERPSIFGRQQSNPGDTDAYRRAIGGAP